MISIGLLMVFAGSRILGLGLANVGLGVIGLWIDRELLRSWPLSPVAWFSAVCIFMGGLGPILIALSGEAAVPSLDKVQLGVFLGHAAFFSLYGLVRPSWARIRPFHLVDTMSPRLLRVLVASGSLALLLSIVEAIVLARTGASDRGAFGTTASGQLFGIWTYFVAFGRVGMVGFILAPLVFVRGTILAKVVTVAAFVVVTGLGFLSGSRGAAFTPLLLVAVGYVAFVRRPLVRLEIAAVILVPVLASGFVFLDHFRNTAGFRDSDMATPTQRLKAITEAHERAEKANVSGMYLLGERLVGTIDNVVYETTPALIPHAGNQNIGAILWLYVPYFLYPYRPIMVDGKAIAEEYLGRALVGTSIGTSLTGDWYRRYGFAGVVVGMALMGIGVGLYQRALFYGVEKQRYFALALWLVLATFITKDSNMTVLSGIWWLFYDLPKNALLLWGCMHLSPLVASFFIGGSTTNSKPVGSVANKKPVLGPRITSS